MHTLEEQREEHEEDFMNLTKCNQSETKKTPLRSNRHTVQTMGAPWFYPTLLFTSGLISEDVRSGGWGENIGAVGLLQMNKETYRIE